MRQAVKSIAIVVAVLAMAGVARAEWFDNFDSYTTGGVLTLENTGGNWQDYPDHPIATTGNWSVSAPNALMDAGNGRPIARGDIFRPVESGVDMTLYWSWYGREAPYADGYATIEIAMKLDQGFDATYGSLSVGKYIYFIYDSRPADTMAFGGPNNTWWSIRGDTQSDVWYDGKFEINIDNSEIIAGYKAHTDTTWIENTMNIPSGFTYEYVGIALYCSGPRSVGDASNDGFVNDNDLSLLLANWQASGEEVGRGQGDFNADQVVNDDDLSLLLANWGAPQVFNALGILDDVRVTAAPVGGAVPDPITLALLAVGGAFVIRKRS